MQSLFPEGLPPAPVSGPTQASPELMRIYDIQNRLRQGYNPNYAG